ncbi:MAG: hypothetical protein J7M16_00340 [Anaerolineae bacterium]|nr:hypothetical protein [Anaerolineae bacterium]
MEQRPATMVDWWAAPEWLTLEQAVRLSGFDAETMRQIIAEGGVDLKDTAGGELLIEKESLREFQEALLLVTHWRDQEDR